MRILTVLNDLGPGGTQRVGQNYTLGYRNAGHDAAVLGFAGGGPRAGSLEREGIQVFLGGADSEARMAAVEAAAGWTPDLVHIHREGRPDSASAAVLRDLKALRRDSLPVIETNVFARVDYSQDRELIDVHLLLSRWCLWKWSRWARIVRPRPLGVLVPYAIDTDAFYPPDREAAAAFRREHGIPDDAFVFGRIGQPAVWKWSPSLLDAFGIVAKEHENAYLLLVGLPDELRPHVEKLDPSIRVRVAEIPFLSSDEALRTAYGAMDVFVHAAQIGESFGMVLVESLLCGTPVITLSTPRRDNSQLEVVGHMEGGLVVTGASSMAAAMERMIEDDDLRVRLGETGIERTARHFGLRRVIPQLDRVANHVAVAATGDALRASVEDDQRLTTTVEDREIEQLLGRSVGNPSMADRFIMRLVHQPHLYRAWSRWKFER